MSIPNNTIGYSAIIMPDMDEYQGFFLVDDPTTFNAVNMMMLTAVASGSNAYGALQAAMIEGATTGRQDVLNAAARAYSGLTKQRFFYVIGYKEEGGTRTEAIEFKARNIRGARKELESLPIVKAIWERRKRIVDE